MKKITSILCALALVLSVSAAPATSFKKGTSIEKTKKELKAHVSADKKAAKTTDFTKNVKASAIRKAAASTAVTITSYSYKFYSEDNDVYAVLTDDANGIDFNFDIYVADGLEDFELGHEYTMADAYAYYCYWMDADWNYADFSEFTFVKTLDADGLINIDATVIDENGDEWVLTYRQPKFPEGGTFVADDITFQLIEAEDVADPDTVFYMLTCTDDALKFRFAILLDGDDVVSEQEYTFADMFADYSWADFDNEATYIDYASASFTKTAAADGSYTIAAVVEDLDGNTWNISAAKAAPSEITIAINKGLIFTNAVDDEGWWQVRGQNDDFYITLSNDDALGITEVAGVYDMADMDASYTYARDLATNTKISFVSGSVTVTDNSDGTYDFAGSFVDADGNTFILDLHYADPIAEKTVTVVAEAEITDYTSSYGAYFIQGTDENGIEVSLFLYATSFEGDFTEDNLYASYSGVYDEGKSQFIFSADINLSATETQKVVSAELLCYNGTLYQVTLTKDIPAPQTFDITINSGVIYTDAIESQGWWQVQARNDDFYVTLSPSSTDHLAGTYAWADFDAGYTFVRDLATDTKVVFASGSITVSDYADETIDFVGAFVDGDGNTYNLNIHYAAPVPTTTKEVVIADGAIDESYASSYNLYGFSGTADDGTYVQLYIFNSSSELVADFTEDDLYPNWSGVEEGSEGFTIFAADIHFDIAANGKDLVMSADLLCYGDVLFEVTMTFADVVPTDVENVEAKSEIIKAIENGQFIIKMNGKEFNANGARVK